MNHSKCCPSLSLMMPFTIWYSVGRSALLPMVSISKGTMFRSIPCLPKGQILSQKVPQMKIVDFFHEACLCSTDCDELSIFEPSFGALYVFTQSIFVGMLLATMFINSFVEKKKILINRCSKSMSDQSFKFSASYTQSLSLSLSVSLPLSTFSLFISLSPCLSLYSVVPPKRTIVSVQGQHSFSRKLLYSAF